MAMVKTEYTRHAAKLARQIHAEAALGGTPAPNAEFFRQLAKALDEIADQLETVARQE